MRMLLNDLDLKLMEHFRGFVVKKDLVRELKLGANVPVFVLEYLLANSCSTTDSSNACSARSRNGATRCCRWSCTSTRKAE